MTPLRRALVGLGAAGAVLALPVAAITATSDHTQLSGLMAALGLLVAWSFLGTGLYLWDRRPDNLTGPLMVALAFSWLVAGLSASSVPGVYIVGASATRSRSGSSRICCSRSRTGGCAPGGTAASSGSAT